MVKRLITFTKSFAIKCRRVWHSLKKPTKEEYETIAKVSAIGVGILGLAGFAVSIIIKLFV